MKTVTASLFVLIMTATSSFAWGEGGCASKNKANLQAMSCEAGWSWDEQAGECVETPTSSISERAERSAPQLQHPLKPL